VTNPHPFNEEAGDRLDYTPASNEESAKWARWQLARLYGDELEYLKSAGEGACDQCALHADVRLQYGTFALCRKCADSRRRARREMEERGVEIEARPPDEIEEAA
jgi:hypothetical protein